VLVPGVILFLSCLGLGFLFLVSLMFSLAMMGASLIGIVLLLIPVMLLVIIIILWKVNLSNFRIIGYIEEWLEHLKPKKYINFSIHKIKKTINITATDRKELDWLINTVLQTGLTPELLQEARTSFGILIQAEESLASVADQLTPAEHEWLSSEIIHWIETVE
jgi:hypothetical protein